MEHSMYYWLGMASGLLVTALGLWLLARRGRKENRECKYDEMQMIARQKAAMHGFVLLMGLDLLGGIAIDAGWFSGMVGTILFAVIAGTVFACECVLRNAYFRVGERKKSWLIFLVAVAGVNYLAALNRVVDGSLLEDGKLGFGCVNLVCGIAITVILVVCLIQLYREKQDVCDE